MPFAILQLAGMVLATAVFLMPLAAMAAEPGGTVVDLAPFLRELLLWALAMIAAPGAALIVKLILSAARWVGIEVEDRRRARLQEIIERGVQYAIDRANHSFREPVPILIRRQIIADAASYLTRHGAETIRALRGDPSDAVAMEELVVARGRPFEPPRDKAKADSQRGGDI